MLSKGNAFVSYSKAACCFHSIERTVLRQQSAWFFSVCLALLLSLLLRAWHYSPLVDFAIMSKSVSQAHCAVPLLLAQLSIPYSLFSMPLTLLSIMQAYEYVSNRLRAVRQDLKYQRATATPEVITMLEQMARCVRCVVCCTCVCVYIVGRMVVCAQQPFRYQLSAQCFQC